ncbi:MAG: hypothetical protein O7G85_04460 [Planctomycetota bacterium]|nr:hypothetical protein [Planctomycetota bacterium]
MTTTPDDSPLKQETMQKFSSLVESIGIKRFSGSLGVSTRQVNRILSGAQPNPVERMIRSLQSSTPESGDQVLDYICQEMGGHFVRHEGVDDAAVNAVKECAEAIAAISDGHISDLDIREIREAISALSSLITSIRLQQDPGE